MKRFFVVIAMLFLAAGLYAEPKISEKQIEAFLNKGNYIEVIVWYGEDKSVSYYNKQSILKLLLESNGEVIIINDKKERVSTFDLDGLEDVKIDAENNLIFTYRY